MDLREAASLGKGLPLKEADLVVVLGCENTVKFLAGLMQEESSPIICISRDCESLLSSIGTFTWEKDLQDVLGCLRNCTCSRESIARIRLQTLGT